MGQKISTKQFAEKVNMTSARIRQLILDDILPAEKIGRDWVIDDSHVETIKNRPEKRGSHMQTRKAA